MKIDQRWLAPAKINLFLQITGQRSDGMHELQTAFQFVDLCDELVFELRNDNLIERATTVPGVMVDDDLSIRAARLLQKSAGIDQGVTISLHKNIPQGGGLGGASSDAATTLRVLNRLWQANVAEEELIRLGTDLGADIPVFLRGQAAWAEGIGDLLTPVDIAESWYLIVDAGVHVSTRDMFSDSQLTRNCPTLTICPPTPGEFGNVFEPIARRRYPVIDSVFDWLSDYGDPFLTGTGGCVVLAVEEKEKALQIHARAPQGIDAYIVKGRNISPLLAQL